MPNSLDFSGMKVGYDSEALRRFCHERGIARLESLGSALGEDFRHDSDVDLLSTLTALPDIPWKLVVGMRNVLIHDYVDVDPARVWKDGQKDIPLMVERLEAFLSSHPLSNEPVQRAFSEAPPADPCVSASHLDSY